jgi:hypothetical protein
MGVTLITVIAGKLNNFIFYDISIERKEPSFYYPIGNITFRSGDKPYSLANKLTKPLEINKASIKGQDGIRGSGTFTGDGNLMNFGGCDVGIGRQVAIVV